ncbi:MAG: exodeoxyribonuclease V subunit gamma [Clostridia bacterium]|nr:exodeoxyribonuclease V subunit gamma [Clostridia bacterium]
MFADIIISKYHEEALEGVISKLKEVNSADLDQSHIIITPDRYTLSLEKKIFCSLKTKGSFNISVLTLKRLCAKISSDKHISVNGAVMLANKAANDCLPRLKCFNNSVKYYGFSQSIYREICRLKNSIISYQDLLNASKSAKGEFALRLHDIALIYQRYNQLTQNKYIDSAAYLHTISDIAADSALIKNSHFYFVGFDEITKAEIQCFLSILKSSIYCCFNVCEGSEISKALTAEFIKEDIFYKEHFIKDQRGSRSDYIYDNIESFDAPNYSKSVKNIKMFAFNDILKETENAAQQIIHQIRHSALRLKDICVILPNAEDYIYSLDKVFKSYNLPYYVAESVKLFDEPLFKALSSLLSLADKCDFENVMAFVKSEYFGETNHNLALFENYCIKYGIDRGRFLQPFTFYDEQDDLAAAENVRVKLASFIDMINKSAVLKEHTASVRSIIEKFNQSKYGELTNYGYIDEAAYRVQAKQKLFKLLDEIDEFATTEKVNLKQFKDMLCSGAQSQKLSIIPVSAYVIVCGGIDSAKYSYCKSVFILGAAEGKFPSINFSPFILSHSDLKRHQTLALAEGDLNLQLKSLHQKIKRLLCFEGDIYISYHTSGGDGKDLAPSEYFSRLSKMFCLQVQSSLDFALEKQILSHTFNQEMLSCCDNLFFKNNKTSVSAIETYFNCPRKFLFRYGYYALPRKEAGLKNLDKGIFLHEAVELFIKEYKAGDDIIFLADRCYEKVLKNRYYRRFTGEITAKAAFYKLKEELYRVCAALAKISDLSDFKPKYLEAKFDDNGEFPLIELSTDNKMYLRGKIDRIDLYIENSKKNVRIIDYKSGNANYIEKSLYFGEKIQLFIYAKALADCGYTPVGVYYFPIHDKYLAQNEKPYKLIGVTVNDKNVLQASDKEILLSGSSGIIDVKLKENGGSYAENKNLISEQCFNSFIVYAQKSVSKAVSEIAQGYIQITPVKGACGYCEYKEVCLINSAHKAVRETNMSKAREIITEAANE